MTTASRRLGELLVDRRLLSKDALESVLDNETTTGVPIARLLIDGGHVREEDLLQAVADRVGMPYIDLDDALLDPEAVGMIDADDARQLMAMPVRLEDEKVVVAVADPFDPETHVRLEKLSGMGVTLALATRTAIQRAINFVHGADVVPLIRQPGVSADAVTIAEPGPLHLNELLSIQLDRGGSDLHLTAGSPPQIRLHGKLERLTEFPVLRPAELRRMIYSILTEKQREKLEETLELDASHPVPGRGRFRMNVYFQRGSVGAAFRAIPTEIKSLQELGIPPTVGELADLQRGLVLVTGPTGSGKSTTLAALIDMINSKRSCHILTVEDPIEFLHVHKLAIVNQREVGADTLGFGAALKHALRQDPDVILVGELRDLETISTALTAAETGHLVIATLHTQDAPQTIDRIVDVFPAHQQQQVRVQLASTIQAIMTQQLVPLRTGKGRVPAVEVMIATSGIRNLIRESKNHQITSAMQAGGKHGMQTMDQSLADLVRRNLISYAVAVERCMNLEDFQRIAGRMA
ncbi:MAG TPA: PilT/PilU family type 4a pilus ATPase [Acidimicrobiia bacterium]|nr:PilT/PilU family type 4a pilus ATPase [Acidimicrobiia bacterium]